MTSEEKDPYQAPSQDEEGEDLSRFFVRRTLQRWQVILFVPTFLLIAHLGFNWPIPGPSFFWMGHQIPAFILLSAMAASILVASYDQTAHRKGKARFAFIAVFCFIGQVAIMAVPLARHNIQ